MSLLYDSFFIIGAILVFAIAAVSVGLVWNGVNTAFQSADISETAKTGVTAMDTGWGAVMDWFFVAFLIGLPLISMGLAYFNPVPSIFFYIVIAITLLMVFIGWGIQAGWESIISSGGAFAAYAAGSMPLTNYLMLHFGMYSVLVVLIIGWGTYVKTTGGSGYA